MNENFNPRTATPLSFLRCFMRIVAIALLAICAIVLLLMLARFALTWVVLPIFVERWVSELTRLVGWGSDISGLVTVAAVFLVSYVVEFVFHRKQRARRVAWAVLAGLTISYFGLHGWLTRNQLYSQTGQPLFYWGLTPAGEVYKQPKSGLNPYTKHPLQPASPDYFILVRTRLAEPMRQVDATTADWFDPNTGWPLLWCARNSNGQLEFFRRPGIHPHYRTELHPVSVELRAEWDTAQLRQVAETKAREVKEAEHQRRREAEAAAERERQARTERDRVEAERREKEAAQARAEEHQKKNEAELAARLAAAEEDRRRRLNEAAQALKRQSILDRRAREAVAQVADLELLTPAHLITNVCPGLTCASFRQEVFEDDFAARRFRFAGRLDRISAPDKAAWFSPTTIGNLHLVAHCVLQPESFGHLSPGRQATIAGTVTAIRFAAGTTNICGIPGQLCLLELGNALLIDDSPATLTNSHQDVAKAASPPPIYSGPRIYSSSQTYTPPAVIYHYSTPQASYWAGPTVIYQPPAVIHPTRIFESSPVYLPRPYAQNPGPCWQNQNSPRSYSYGYYTGGGGRRR